MPFFASSRRRALIALVVVMAWAPAAACQGGSSGTAGSARDEPAAAGRSAKSDASAEDGAEEGEQGAGKQACGRFSEDRARERPVAKAVTLAEGDRQVRAVVYPAAGNAASYSSQWGQGLVVGGRYYSAVGDECGPDGNSYFYEYDPSTGEMRLFADVLSVTGHERGAWGYGKIHGQLVPGPDGLIYTTTYWGSKKGLTYDKGYEGDVILRIDPATKKVTSLGAPVAERGIPSAAGWARGGLLYGEAVDPNAKPKRGPFFVYDVRAEKVVFRADPEDHVGFRNVMVDGQGRAYFSAGDSRLYVWDPATKKLETSAIRLPGDWVRASTRPGPDGTVYGVTKNPRTIFALRPDGSIDTLGETEGYTASMALSPDGKSLYYVPFAQGTSWEQGTPLMRVDTETGRHETVVALNELAEKQLGLRLGGSYNIALDPKGERAFIGFNANEPTAKSTFGRPVLVTVELS